MRRALGLLLGGNAGEVMPRARSLWSTSSQTRGRYLGRDPATRAATLAALSREGGTEVSQLEPIQQSAYVRVGEFAVEDSDWEVGIQEI